MSEHSAVGGAPKSLMGTVVIGVTVALVGLVVIAIVLAGRESDRDQAASATTIAVQQKHAQEEVVARLKQNWTEVAHSRSEPPSAQIAAYRAFADAAQKAASADVPMKLDDGKRRLIDQMEGALKAFEDSTKPPETKDKPEYQKPEYDGAFHLSGAFRGRYNDGGIVVQRGRDYFIVEDADVPMMSWVSGYVKRTGGMEILDIGGGRSADVVKLTDRQEYEEDQSEYRDEVATAKKEYKDETKAYEDWVRDQKLAASEKGRAEQRARAALSETQRNVALLAFIDAIGTPTGGP